MVLRFLRWTIGLKTRATFSSTLCVGYMCPLPVSIVCVRCDCRSEGFIWIWFYDTQMETSLPKISITFKRNKQKTPSTEGVFGKGERIKICLSHDPSCRVPLLPSFKLPLWLKRGTAWVICLLRIHLREEKSTHGQDQILAKSSKLREANTVSIWPSSSVIFNINIVETEPDKCDNMTPPPPPGGGDPR